MFYGWEKVEKDHVIGLLISLRDLFKDPKKWCDWPIAVDSTGLEVQPTDPAATRWSLIGATEKLAAMVHKKPLCDFVAVASREFLNDLSDDKLIRGDFSYEDEVAIIELGIEDLEK